MNLHHPIVAAAIVPLILCLVLAGVIRFAGRERLGRRFAGAAIGTAATAALLLALGTPQWPPPTGVQKVPYVFAVATVAGIALDARRTDGFTWPAVVASWGAILWIAWPQLAQGRAAALIVPIVLALAMIPISARLAILREDGAMPLVMIIAAGLGLAGVVAVADRSLAIAQIGVALAAAAGAYALWNWPRPRLPLGAAGVVACAAAVASIAALVLLTTKASPWTMLPIAAVFFADLATRRLTPRPGRARQLLAPVLLGVAAATLAGAAIILATASAHADSDPRYR